MKLGIGLSLSLPFTAGVGGPPYPRKFNVILSNPTGGLTIADGTGVCTINYVGQLNPVITTQRISGVAPLSVNFNVALSQINPSLSTLPFHEVRYTWDFGDAKGTKWARGNKPGVIDKNFHVGPTAAHLFEDPGTYTVTVTGWHYSSSGVLTTGSKTVTITVQDPAVVFAGANTIAISNTALPVAGVGGVPAGASCFLDTNWPTALARASGGTKRILFKRGETWTTTADGAIPTGTIGHVGAYGTGADPKIIHNANVRGIFISSGKNDWRITDLEFESSESGSTDADNQYKIPIDVISSSNITVARVKTRTSFIAMQAQLSDYCAMYDCDMQDTFTNYGNMLAFFYKCHGVSVIGSSLNRSSRTHTLRISGTSSCCVAYNDIKNPGSTRDAITVRGWEAPTPITQYVQISDNLIDGGEIAGYVLYCGIVNINTNEELRDVIVERNTILSDSPATPCVFGVAQGLTFRSNIVNCVHEAGISIGWANAVGAPSPSSSWFYDNTIYKSNTLTSQWWSTFTITGVATGVVIKNNLAYAPGNNGNNGQVGPQGTMIYTSGSVTGSDITASNNTSDTQLNTVQPWAASSPLAVIEDYAPNSYGLNSGVYVPVFDDTTGAVITGTRDLGAVQV